MNIVTDHDAGVALVRQADAPDVLVVCHLEDLGGGDIEVWSVDNGGEGIGIPLSTASLSADEVVEAMRLLMPRAVEMHKMAMTADNSHLFSPGQAAL